MDEKESPSENMVFIKPEIISEPSTFVSKVPKQTDPLDVSRTDHIDKNETKKSNNNNECGKCGNNFGRAADLKKHIRYVHEGLKNHKCETCGKAFSQLHHLKGHIRSVHQGTIHKLRRHKRQDSSSKDDVG